MLKELNSQKWDEQIRKDTPRQGMSKAYKNMTSRNGVSHTVSPHHIQYIRVMLGDMGNPHSNSTSYITVSGSRVVVTPLFWEGWIFWGIGNQTQDLSPARQVLCPWAKSLAPLCSSSSKEKPNNKNFTYSVIDNCLLFPQGHWYHSFINITIHFHILYNWIFLAQ